MTGPLRKEREVLLLQGEKARPKRIVQKKKFRLSKGRLPALIALLILMYLAASFGNQFSRISSLQREIENIQQQVNELQQKNAALRQELQMVQSDSYIEKIAREKLGLVKPGETRVVPVPEGTRLKTVQPPDTNSFAGD
ncbi:MAG TPA: septum formation initiator family protein [Bacillota bacterium]|nr:septum formation initiator family protein [Bacillota bacterium]